MIIMKLDHLAYIESIFGTILYVVGIAGSYYRFGKFERRGKIDAAFLAFIQWGGALLVLSLLNLLKYNFIPTLHSDLVRVLYYTGTLISSSVFYAKSFESGMKRCRYATYFLWGTMAFVVGEGLMFYLDLSYGAAILSCIGFLIACFFWIPQRPNFGGILAGVAVVLLPIVPKISNNGFDLDKLSAKRELAISNLLEIENVKEGQENGQIAEVNCFDLP